MSMKSVVTGDAILKKVREKSFERGRSYYESGMVESVVHRGNRLFAEVMGSECDPYYVNVTFQEGDFSALCSCPYDWEGYCKHIVAVLLTWVHDRGLVVVRAPIEDLLLKLDADKLRALILHMIESEPQLSKILDGFFQHADVSI